MSELGLDCLFSLCQHSLRRLYFNQLPFIFNGVHLQIPKLRPRVDFRQLRCLFGIKEHVGVTLNKSQFVFTHALEDAGLTVAENPQGTTVRHELDIVWFS